MDQQQIKTLIAAMAASDLAEMEFAQDGWSLRLVRRAPGVGGAARNAQVAAAATDAASGTFAGASAALADGAGASGAGGAAAGAGAAASAEAGTEAGAAAGAGAGAGALSSAGAAGAGTAASPLSAAPAHLLAPLYGVVHLAPGPGEAPFVAVGQAVRAGQVLCVIEAMKVFNQVVAEHDGRVAEILVESGQEVDAEQALLRFA